MKIKHSQKIKTHYNLFGENYLKCWGSLAKQDVSNFELDFISSAFKYLSHLKKPIKVLEVGIGPGRIAQEILKHNVQYYGLDISTAMVDYSKKKFTGSQKVKNIVVADISIQNPFPNIKFDLIIAMRVIHYNQNWQDIIKKLSTKLAPGGVFAFCTLNQRSSAILGKLISDDLLKGYYTHYSQLNKVIKNNKFKTLVFKGYARIPDVIYDRCNHPISAFILRFIEKIITSIFGEILFMRMFYVVTRK